jgi:hypothetical protein
MAAVRNQDNAVSELCVKRYKGGIHIGQKDNKPLPLLPSITMASNGIILTEHFPRYAYRSKVVFRRLMRIDVMERYRTMDGKEQYLSTEGRLK